MVPMQHVVKRFYEQKEYQGDTLPSEYFVEKV